MLVLSWKQGESVVIGDNVKVYFLGYKNGKPRIGVEAPPDIPIHREKNILPQPKKRKRKKEKRKSP